MFEAQVKYILKSVVLKEALVQNVEWMYSYLCGTFFKCIKLYLAKLENCKMINCSVLSIKLN